MKIKKKTQRALAKYVGATEATVSRWVNGEVVPRHARLDKVCEFLMCAPEDLLLDAIFESLAITGFQKRVFYHFTHFHKKDK